MKKILLYLAALLPALMAGQASQNYVKKTVYKEPTQNVIANPTAAQASVSMTYFDGLGRPIQQVAHKQSATGKDIVTPFDYDAYGRQQKEYLPFPSSGSTLAYDPNALANQAAYYSNASSTPGFETTSNPYRETKFEPSPLNRMLKQAAPGNTWAMEAGKEVRTDYQTNSVADAVRLFDATAIWDPSSGLYITSLVQAGTSNHEANELYKTITKDENWNASAPLNGITEVYKDKKGRPILKRSYGEAIVNGVSLPNQKHDTYYVYDQFDNQSFVIPPKADGTITETVLKDLCYQYRYDYRNRLVEKKVPGKGWEFIIYDKLDRIVATGPALSPFSNFTAPGNIGWLITKYDIFNRPVYTGWMQSAALTSAERKTIQDARNAETGSLNESRTASASTFNGIPISYSNLAWPTGSDYHLLTISYYDDYNFTNGPTDFSDVEGQSVYFNLTVKPTSLATGSWTRALQASTDYAGEASFVLYDRKARVLRAMALNYLGGHTITDRKIDAFSGTPEYTVTYQKRTTGDIERYIKNTYTYNDQDRLVLHLHQIGQSGTPQLLSKNEYDELGRLVSKKVGGTDATAAEYYQKVDYAYTARGWLKEINSVDHFDDGENIADFFAFKINYENVENDVNGQIKELHNGNISETFWRSRSDGHKRSYSYGYDGLNRLRKAVYHKDDQATHSYDEQLAYDKNGNIMSLQRNGDLDTQSFSIEIDDLTYTYDSGNRLQSVNDSSLHPAGFDNLINGPEEYFYDAHGNVTTDENKGIVVSYNHLNLPVKIVFRDGRGTIEYLYDASGEKLRKKVSPSGSGITETDYLSGFQYVARNLNLFPTAEGYVRVVYSRGVPQYRHVFNFTDHIGNVRMSYGYDPVSHAVMIMEENHNYPFGLKHEKYNSDTYEYVPTEEGEQYPVGISPLGPEERKTYQYKYNGKEWQDELGLNMTAMDFRLYDNAIGRFHSVDALAELGYSHNPYHFAYNSPIFWSDPSGLISGGPAVNAMWDHTGNGKTSTWINDGYGNFDNIDGTGLVNRDGVYWENNVESFDEVTVEIYRGDRRGASFLVQSHIYQNGRFYSKFREDRRKKVWDDLQEDLDYVGGLPLLGEPFDLINAGISGIRGDYGMMGLSLAATIPIGGQLATVVKIQKHHVIPKAVFKEFKDDLKGLVKRDGIKNMMDLPVPYHLGGHKQYNDFVKNALDGLKKDGLISKESLEALQDNLRTIINEGKDSGKNLNDYFRQLNNP